jgi:hypothetical protein
MGFVVIESQPTDTTDPVALRHKWEEVAEDMALIPEANVRVEVRDKDYAVLISEEMYDCLRGV